MNGEETYVLRFKPTEDGWVYTVERNLEYVPPCVYLRVLQTLLAAEQAAYCAHLNEMQERSRRN